MDDDAAVVVARMVALALLDDVEEHLETTVANTDALKELHTTIDAAGAITDGLNRGRKRLGG